MSGRSSTTTPIKTALYGGAFDPLHNGHLATIAALLSSGVVDEVVVIPSGDRPDKPNSTAATFRLQMCQLAVDEAFAGDSRVSVSDLHAAQNVGYGTIDLVRHFAGDAAREIFVVIGHELLRDLPSWKEADELRQRATFLVIERPGVADAAVPEGWRVVPFRYPYEAGVNVSSTLLRRLLSEGKSCAGLMPRGVEVFCRRQKLYQASTCKG